MPDKSEKRVRSFSSPRRDDEEDGVVRMRRRLSYKTVSDVSLHQVQRRLLRQRVRLFDGNLFVPVPTIRAFWTVECKLAQFFKDIHCLVSSASAHRILTVSIRVFTALVLVDWDSDDRFCQVIQENFSDEKHPTWTDDSLAGAGFSGSKFPGLSQHEVFDLRNNMGLVSVPVLSKESKTFPEHTTLPITKKREIGKGAYGKVYEIEIAKGCLLVDNNGGTASSNKAEDCFALKEMNDLSESQRELDFLREYRAMSRHSNHIVIHLAIIVRGNEASVIYPLATGDLQKLLEGQLESFQWSSQDANQFRDIVGKSCDLADGLEFLHSGMRNHSRFVCRHGDLKPNNFLIFSTEWKISDMGLARVKAASTDESGVRKTTKTTSRNGCGPYAAPEMSGPEGTPVGRETDVWSLAAIIMELIIWGFGGPQAWRDFRRDREQCSNGLFHKNDALSQAVDEQLRSWPDIHLKMMTRFLKGDNEGASRFLEDLVNALRGALIIEPNRRATSKNFLDSMDKAYKHLGKPMKVKQRMPISNRLEIRSSPSITAWQALQRKFQEHRQSDIFTSTHFKPNEQIRVSNETEDDIKEWIRQPTPSALCILKGYGNEWLHVSAITHEVYYTARSMDYDVIEFLTLNRYDRTATPLQASLDFVYCFIFQLLKETPQDQLKEYPLEKLAIEDSRLSEPVRFESAVDILGQIINIQHKHRAPRQIIVIVDEFWRVCTRTHLDATRQQWEKLLVLLGCATSKMNGKSDAGSSLVAPHFRVLIRANGWYNELQDLGFNGKLCHPSTMKQPNALTLRTTLEESFKNVG